MKKLLFSLFLCGLSFVTIYAQDSHLKFMGIELNGTITQFQNKLAAKGVTVSNISNSLPAGTRAFKGTFSGNDADIYVYYNTRTKIVYRAKAVIDCYGQDRVLQEKNEMEAKLDAKYGTENKASELVKDEYGHEFEQCLYNVDNGIIGTMITSSSYGTTGVFFYHVDYYDKDNYNQNISEEMDDL